MELAHQHRAETNREALKAFSILGIVFCTMLAAAYVYRLHGSPPFPRDGSTLVVGRDFLNFWMYGRAAALPDPSLWYDVEIYQRAIAALLGPAYPGQNWSYPPTVMLFAAPFGHLPYLPALLVWTLLGLTIFLSVAARYVSDRRALIALMASPAALFCVISGQSSLFTCAMLVGIFGLLDRRPLIAGALIGFLTLKPQLGVLFPIMLIASGRWHVFTAAAVTAIVLAMLAAALFGADVWVDFVTQGLPVQNEVMADARGIATPYYPTVFMNLRGIGFGYGAAMTAQLVVTLAAAGIVIWAFRYRAGADSRMLFALFIACSIAAVPYLLVYDTLALTFAMLALLAGNLLDGRGSWLARLVYWLPLLQIGLGMLRVPGPALIAPAVAVYLAFRLKPPQSAAPATGT